MKRLPGRVPGCHVFSLLVTAIFSASFLTACGDGSTITATTAQDYFETPKVPYHFSPFHPTTDAEGEGWNPDDYKNKLPLKSPPAGVDAKVESVNVLMSGWTKGGLRFHTQPRGNFSDVPNMTYPETNDNGNLGGESCGFVYLYFKYEPEVNFAGDLTKCCYGSMATGQMDPKSKEPIVFKNLVIENDTIGREWHYNSNEPFADWKKKFPVVNVEAKTVRWIDCMGGAGGSLGAGWEGKKVYVMIYAGVDKCITHAKIFRIDYPEGKKPTMTEVPTMEALLKETTAVTYSPDKVSY
ncbi:MAG: hypothetical protein IT342_19945 [Candidatus Melainabacteria bacterium]|nr:hypothetical protein [Candidatus Melainabacteria bacterium]